MFILAIGLVDLCCGSLGIGCGARVDWAIEGNIGASLVGCRGDDEAEESFLASTEVGACDGGSITFNLSVEACEALE